MSQRPNVILILADDMGFADIGCFGSEIKTPNIDSMMVKGTALSAMYNCARCCPTRASLLTGLYPHKAGIGHMTADFGSPAYQGFLRNDSATIAEVLRLNGYQTLMSGKWHVGGEFGPRAYDDWTPGDVKHPTAKQRGFDRFYGIHDGACSFYSPHYLMEDDGRIEVHEEDFHLTDAISDKAVDMIERAALKQEPFFLYLAYTAPHWPLHAHPEDCAKYEGVYNQGWDAIRTARHEEMNGRKMVLNPWEISPRDFDAPPWEAIEHKDWEAAKMATYAAMVDRMDQGIGRVLDCLKRLDIEEDTLILFLSDNGGCAEFMAEEGWAQFYPTETHNGIQVTMGNRPEIMPGGADTFQSYDLPWANASNAPFRLFKHWVHEGGISTPLIVQWPKRLKPQGVRHEASHVVDILPTIMEATGSSYPDQVGGNEIQPLDGESLLPMLSGKDWQREQPIYWEHEGNMAIRDKEWKLVKVHGQDWELYQMEDDRTELNDLSAKNIPVVDYLSKEHAAWCQSVGVRDWDQVAAILRQKWGMDGVD